jgi:hypothetical protein
MLKIRIGDDVRMMGNGSGSRPLLTARAVKVPLAADSVAPPRLAYGGRIWRRTRAGTTAIRPSTSRLLAAARSAGSPSKGSTPSGPRGARRCPTTSGRHGRQATGCSR